jgi:hypothetical protein
MNYFFYLLICGMLCFSAPAMADVDLDGINIGGALRVQYGYKDWDEASKDKGGDFAFDTFRLSANGEIGEMILSAEYRWYPEYDFETIHHGWIGYNFNENWQAQIGVHQVPFGIQPYASHNFWFSGAYYVGLEDDYDMGIKALYNDGPLSLTLAFYKNGELGSPSDAGRYSVDVLNYEYPDTFDGLDNKIKDNKDLDQNNEETNQGNIRLAYTFTHSDTCSTEIGFSGEYGGIRNSDTSETGDHWAGAVHMVGNYGRWNIQLEGIQYEYDLENPDTAQKDVLYGGAYSYAWGMPMKAQIGTFNVAYGLPVDFGPISKLTFYSDNTIIQADNEGKDWDQTWQNVVGCMISAGPVYTYIDIISAENMPFMGGSMVDNADGWQSSNNRNTRININFGYYF